MSVDSTAKAISKMKVGEDNANAAVEENANAAVGVATKNGKEFKVSSENPIVEDNANESVGAATQTEPEGRMADIDAIKLFVGQIPRTMNKEDLLPMFEEFGEIYSLSIIKHRVTNEHAGCVFLTFFTRAAADKAIAALHDKRVLTGMKNAMQVKPAHGELQCKLFVGMIPHTCTASQIESVFLRFGEIVELNVLKRRSKISNKGCAFIQYKYKHQALRAIEELHGKHVIEGSTTPLVVKFADNRKSNKSAGRGRWRGGDHMQRYGGFQPGYGYAPPYQPPYYPNPMVTAQQFHQAGGNMSYGGGNMPYGGGHGQNWGPMYYVPRSVPPPYYGGPNPNERFFEQYNTR